MRADGQSDFQGAAGGKLRRGQQQVAVFVGDERCIVDVEFSDRFIHRLVAVLLIAAQERERVGERLRVVAVTVADKCIEACCADMRHRIECAGPVGGCPERRPTHGDGPNRFGECQIRERNEGIVVGCVAVGFAQGCELFASRGVQLAVEPDVNAGGRGIVDRSCRQFDAGWREILLDECFAELRAVGRRHDGRFVGIFASGGQQEYACGQQKAGCFFHGSPVLFDSHSGFPSSSSFSRPGFPAGGKEDSFDGIGGGGRKGFFIGIQVRIANIT